MLTNMKSFHDPIIAEVRHNREILQEMYGGWEGYCKHLDEDCPRLEAQGWHFVTPEEHSERIARHHR
jgi:hypothetical protein